VGVPVSFLVGRGSVIRILPVCGWQIPARRLHDGGSGRSHEKSPARQAALHFLVGIRSVIRSLPALRCHWEPGNALETQNMPIEDFDTRATEQ